MSEHRITPDDQGFRAELEACRFEPARFDHRAHVRLAYVYLVEHEATTAAERMRATLQAFLRHNGVDLARLHETLTHAWILAVRHFMEQTSACPSADAFIDANPGLLDAQIMLTHYSAEVLFSSDARVRFVEPDVDPIPRHES